MFVKQFICGECGESYPKDKARYLCACGGVVRIGYDYRRLKKDVNWKKLRDRPFNHYRYQEFYPHIKKTVTMKEGGTPLIPSSRHKNTYFKMESQNPTGSFKDRGSTCELSHAIAMRAKNVICASTGNMGASVSAYSARGDVQCTIVLPSYASGEKIQQIKNYGAHTRRLRGNYTKAMKAAYRAYEQHRAYLVGDYAYRGEGEKSVGFEIMDEIPDVRNIILPIGNGTLLAATWRGLREMRYAGLIKRLPRLIGVQAKGCSPVYKAYISGKNIKPMEPDTIAGAIACGDPIDGEAALKEVKSSRGKILAVTDKEILNARRELAREEGIDAEPSGVVCYAAWKKLNRPGKSVLVVTGHGLKDLSHV